MKRRNFFSKIAKCLLGIGIAKALPTPEVETASEITDSNLNILRQTLNRTRQASSGDRLYFAEPFPKDTWIAYDLDGNRKPDSDFTAPPASKRNT